MFLILSMSGSSFTVSDSLGLVCFLCSEFVSGYAFMKSDEIIMSLIISNELVVGLVVHVMVTYIINSHHNLVDVRQGSPLHFVSILIFCCLF